MNCKNCNKEFTPTDGRQKHCCVKCSLEYARNKQQEKNKAVREAKLKITAKCEVCGKEYAPRNKASKYCSDACRDSARKEYEKYYNNKHRPHNADKIANEKTPNPKKYYIPITHDPVECTICGKMYTPKSKSSRFCGDECRKKNLAKLNRKQADPVKCETCGVLFHTKAAYKYTECPKCRSLHPKITAEQEPPRRQSNIDALTKQARELNITYGELQKLKYFAIS